KSGAALLLKDLSEDVYLEADVKEIEDFVTISGNATLPNGGKAPFTDIYVVGEKPFTSYYLRTDANGAYSVKVEKNNSYELRMDYNGYRTTTVDVDVAEQNVTLDFALEDYVIGGSAQGFVSNTAAWDLSKESENCVVLDLLDRTSGGSVYFSNVYSNSVVIEVTITNLTNQEISEPYYKTNSNLNGEYESDPGAGIRVATKKGSSYYMLYKNGYRNRWNNGSYNDMHLDPTCGKNYIFQPGQSIKLKLARYGEQFYMYIDDNLVYAEKNSFLGDEKAVYGFFYDSSAILKLQYSDYSILYGEEAEEEIAKTLLAKFNYDESIIQVDGLRDGYGLYNTDAVIFLKNIPNGKARLVTVGEERYYLTAKNNSIVYSISDYGAAAMPDVNIVCGEELDAYLVSGSVNVASDMLAYTADGTYTYFQTEENGNYQIYLPNGTYYIIAQANGYMGDYKTVTVAGAAVTAGETALYKELLGTSVNIKNPNDGSNVEVLSRPLGYPISFKEK
ncbi:MAG: carboxypeptidase-like regulatory domain-containing protein, partial [Candidatus Scatosoma sp.]